MPDPHLVLSEAIRSASFERLSPSAFEDPVHRRLASALKGISTAGPADIATMLRHFLAKQRAQTPTADPSVVITGDAPWPDTRTLSEAGLVVARNGVIRTLRPSSWHPAWLDGSSSCEPGRSATAEEGRRSYETVAGDPFLRPLGWSEYRCVGQREAVRAVLSMPPGTTLALNLPTGSGKSLCAQLPALVGHEMEAVTVVVVPTTALAIDQERAMKPWLSHDTAFYGEEASSTRRSGILERLRDGTQRIVFASPEALLGGLRSVLHTAAKSGALRYLVIDEAHIVEQWGEGFRSAFQELGGLRNELLRISPTDSALRTVLMSATLTAQCINTLEALFAANTTLSVLSAAQLRPEPEYWSAVAASEAQRVEWVMEAVHRLPRALLLYVIRPAEADVWLDRLRVAGYRRCRSVTGKTPTVERERVVQAWQAQELDIVVATAAFGVGMDQQDVRTVIHACMPENIDRFYQEVGRGGRDGKASVSLIVWTADDVRVAESLNRSTVIGIQRGRERWQRMFSDTRRIELGGDRYFVPVDVVPTLNVDDIGMVNERNEEWNIRTLTLMSRAGLIALDSVSRYELSGANGTSAEMPSFAGRTITILDEHHNDESRWQACVTPERERARMRDAYAHALMKAVLAQRTCVAQVFTEAYSVSADTVGEDVGSVRVSPSCGGCPDCRRRGTAPYAGAMPYPLPAKNVYAPIGPSLHKLLEGRGAAVFWDGNALNRTIRLLWWVASQGFRNVVISDVLLATARDLLANQRALSIVPFITPLAEYSPLTSSRLPTVFLIDETEVPDQILAMPPYDRVASRIWLLRKSARAVSRPDRFLREVVMARRFSLAEFETLLSL